MVIMPQEGHGGKRCLVHRSQRAEQGNGVSKEGTEE